MAGPIRRMLGWLSGDEPGAPTWPPPEERASGPRERIVLGRRLRQLRAERDAALEELGSMALDMHRRDAVRSEYLGKGAEEVAELSREIEELEDRLGIAPDEPTTDWEQRPEEPEPEPEEPVLPVPAPPEPVPEEPAGTGVADEDSGGVISEPEPEEPEPQPEPEEPAPPEPQPVPEEPAGTGVADEDSGGVVSEPDQPTTMAWSPAWAHEEPEAPEPGWPERTHGSWRVPLAVALVVAGICVLVLALNYSGKRDDAREEVGANAVANTTPTSTTPASRTTRTRTSTTGGTTTTRRDGAATSRTPARWPPGRSGWTVSLLTSSNEGEATRRAREAIGRGLRAGVLDSARVEGVAPGQLIVFAGRYTSRSAAEDALTRASEAGFSGAYPISVRR